MKIFFIIFSFSFIYIQYVYSDTLILKDRKIEDVKVRPIGRNDKTLTYCKIDQDGKMVDCQSISRSGVKISYSNKIKRVKPKRDEKLAGELNDAENKNIKKANKVSQLEKDIDDLKKKQPRRGVKKAYWSLAVPGLGDHLNKNKKWGWWWSLSTLFWIAVHKDSYDYKESTRSDYDDLFNVGVFSGNYDSINTFYTFYKFQQSYDTYESAVTRYKYTGNILIAWWLANFGFAYYFEDKSIKDSSKAVSKVPPLNLSVSVNPVYSEIGSGNPEIHYSASYQWRF